MSAGGGGTTTCPGCGTAASGHFCSQCGSRLAAQTAAGAICAACEERLKPGALYCGNCGQAVGARPRKDARSHLPWILSALALVAFSVVIALLVQGQSLTRTANMGLTGGIPGQPGGSPGPGGGAAAGGSTMPSAEELANMSPREAADRLFERAMRAHGSAESGDGLFFVDMALQAYDRVPAAQRDADVHFHVGLLQLVQGNADAASASARAILDKEPEHLLGLVLSARVADFEGRDADAEAFRGRVRTAVEGAGGIPDRPEYQAHRALIDAVVSAEGP